MSQTEHALVIDGVLVTAGSLINGTTITLYDASDHSELEFFHIKLARHNVIYRRDSLRDGDQRRRDRGSILPITFVTTDLKQLNKLRARQCSAALASGKSRLRSAISPWIDRRQKLDIIRDELEERGIAVLRDRGSSRDLRVSA